MPKSNEYTPLFDDLPMHKKTRAFRAITGWETFQTMGFLYMFWRQVGKDSPYGLLAGLARPELVLDAIGCRKEKIPELVAALLESGWIDRSENEGEYIVHDWAEGAGKFTIKKEKDRLRKQEERKNKRLAESVRDLSTDSPRTDDGQSATCPHDVHAKEKKGKEKKETTYVCDGESSTGIFEAQFDPRRIEIIDSWKEHMGKAGLGTAITQRDKTSASTALIAIDSGDYSKEQLFAAMDNLFDDPEWRHRYSFQGFINDLSRWLNRKNDNDGQRCGHSRTNTPKARPCGQADFSDVVTGERL